MALNKIWKGSPNHYNGRKGYSVKYITLHVMAGFLAGTDSVFSRSSFKAATHYGIGAQGQIHQYVDERNGAWGDGNYVSNLSSISIEHEGGIPQAKYTEACENASAQLCADIARRYGWKKLTLSRTGNVRLHRWIPGTTHTSCPDLAPNGINPERIVAKANAILGGGSVAKATPAKSTARSTNVVPLVIDGSEGPLTTRAEQRFLNRTNNAGLVVDGSRGPLTNRAWQNYFNKIKARDWENKQLVVDGSFGPRTTSAMQKWLNGMGYTDYQNKRLDVDGSLGKRTVSALQKFLNAKKAYK